MLTLLAQAAIDPVAFVREFGVFGTIALLFALGYIQVYKKQAASKAQLDAAIARSNQVENETRHAMNDIATESLRIRDELTTEINAQREKFYDAQLKLTEIQTAARFNDEIKADMKRRLEVTEELRKHDRAKLDGLEKTVNSLKDENSSLREHITRLQFESESLKQVRLQLEADLEAAHQREADAVTQRAQSEQVLATERAAWDGERTQLNATINGLKTKVEQLESQIRELQNRLAQLEGMTQPMPVQ